MTEAGARLLIGAYSELGLTEAEGWAARLDYPRAVEAKWGVMDPGGGTDLTKLSDEDLFAVLHQSLTGSAATFIAAVNEQARRHPKPGPCQHLPGGAVLITGDPSGRD